MFPVTEENGEKQNLQNEVLFHSEDVCGIWLQGNCEKEAK